MRTAPGPSGTGEPVGVHNVSAPLSPGSTGPKFLLVPVRSTRASTALVHVPVGAGRTKWNHTWMTPSALPPRSMPLSCSTPSSSWWTAWAYNCPLHLDMSLHRPPPLSLSASYTTQRVTPSLFQLTNFPPFSRCWLSGGPSRQPHPKNWLHLLAGYFGCAMSFHSVQFQGGRGGSGKYL